MNYCCIFPETQNIHLIKDVGIMPYIMKEQFDIDSYIITYKNGNYPYLKNEVKGLKIDYINKITGNASIDTIIYILKNKNKIDILQVYHPSARSLIWILIYKFLNKNGKSYLKMDTSPNVINDNVFLKKNLKGVLKKYIIKKKTNLISAESKEVCNTLNEKYHIDVKYIPNGFYDYNQKENLNYEEKENVILTVARIGAPEKQNQLLMEAFAKSYPYLSGWKLKLVGPIQKSFKEYIKQYFERNPHLKDIVIFTDAIYDRNLLNLEYKKSKIFVMTSLVESFPLVCAEAIRYGDYIIMSNVGCVNDITNDATYGDLFKCGDVEQLSEKLKKACNSNKVEKLAPKIRKRGYDNFYWPVICEKVLKYLKIKIKTN